MNIRDLAALTGAAERQIRYMIAEGFVASPRGSRAQPDYGDDHLAAIRRYLALRALGLPPAAIRVLNERQGAVPIPLAEGVTLSIDARLLGQGLDVPGIATRVAAVLRDLCRETHDGRDRDPTKP